MDKRTTDTLAKFCIDQSCTFNSRDWLFLNEIDERPSHWLRAICR